MNQYSTQTPAGSGKYTFVPLRMNNLEKQLMILSETLRTVGAPNRARVESAIGLTKEEVLLINSPENVMALMLRSNLEISVY